MSRLSRHIRILLHRHDKIMVPGIGMFFSKYSPAYFEEETGTFYPFNRKYYFSALTSGDYTILINSYSRKEGLTTSEAEKTIRDDVEAVRSEIEEAYRCRLTGLGTLYGELDSLCFRFDPGFECSDPSTLYPILSLSNQIMGNRAKSDAASMVSNKSVKEDYYYLRISKKWARIAASFLLVMTVGIFALLLPVGGMNSPQTASIVPVDTPKANEIKHVESEPSSPILQQPDSDVSQEFGVEEDNSFFLIVGAFKTMPEARKFVERYGENDLKMEILEGRKLIKISIASATTAHELREKMNDETLKSRFPKMWIWEKP